METDARSDPPDYVEGLEHNAVEERSSERLYLAMADLDKNPGRAGSCPRTERLWDSRGSSASPP